MAQDTKVSVPPLKAHETRNIEWAKTAKTEQEKAEFLAKAAGFRKRIDAILGAPQAQRYRLGDRSAKAGADSRERHGAGGTGADPIGTSNLIFMARRAPAKLSRRQPRRCACAASRYPRPK